MERLLDFIKKDMVLAAASLLAVLSAFFVPPSLDYLGYIDFKVLSLLFCLMAVVSGFISCGVFDKISRLILKSFSSIKPVALLLVLGCFFSSMLVTNDVALISFVPLTIGVLSFSGSKNLIFTIVMETIAANLGSMMTPIGNPQNLFLYSHFSLSLWDFFKTLFPFGALSLLLAIVAVLTHNFENLPIKPALGIIKTDKKVYMYLALFVLSVLSVLHLADYRLCLIIVFLTLFIFDRQRLFEIDYGLLLTFLAFFIFVGNLSLIPFVKNLITLVLSGNELLRSVILSQIISNVPCAIMLSGFTKNALPLLLGVNIGGLGTLVGSLASLISFKLYCKTPSCRKAEYLKVFTLYNLIFLAFLMGFTLVVPML